MEVIESRKETNTLRRYKACSVEVPANYSRQKAMSYARDHREDRNGMVDPVPQSDARQQLYLMLMKIGATSELPQEKNLRVSFLNDFWSTIYLKNNYCPGDIPFHIILTEFTTAIVQGSADRKGNNQAAICQAFNKWISQDKVRHRLYQLRDEAYPAQKPKQVAQNATPETVRDYSNEKLQKRLQSLRPMAGVGMVDQMIGEYEREIKRRSNG